MRRISNKIIYVFVSVFIAASLLAGVGPLRVQSAHGLTVDNRSLTLDNSVPGQTATYVMSFDISSAGTLGSIKMEFCDNTALFEVACNPPSGLDLSTATLTAQSGETGFVIDPLSNANTLILSRAPTLTTGGVTAKYTLSGVRSANASGTQYSRYSTYPTNDATGAETDRGAVAYSLNPSFQVSSEVPPYLQFCLGITITGIDCNTAEGDYVNMGNFNTNYASTGQTQIVVGTNAANGYSIIISGNTMNSGTNAIPPLAQPTASAPGISQFGINLRNNSNPSAGQEPSGNGSGVPEPGYNQSDQYKYHSGDIIASRNTVEDFRKFTVTYLVNISRSQLPGVYSSTFTYTGTGNF